MMDNIDTFAREAAAQFHQQQQKEEERFNLHLSPNVVEDFIKSSYYASLIPDETRWPCVCLICYKKVGEESFHILFDSPIDISAHEIAKVSHAVADECHICCISDNGKLTISGIQLTYLHDRRDLGYSSSRHSGLLRLFIRGPGHIEISTGGMAKIYKAGKISEESLLQYSDIMGYLEAAIGQKMQPDTDGAVEALPSIFNDIAKVIVRLGHGGLLLIADEPKKCYFSSSRQVDSPLLQQLLIQYWNSTAALVAESGGAHNLLDMAASGETWYGNSLVVAANVEMLEKCIRAIAGLAGMDGAMVLNYKCKIVAFNAIITKAEDDPQRYHFINQDDTPTNYEDVVKNRGSRHQSALSFVMRIPNSFAFVISQDNAVSAFHNPGSGRIICGQEMRVLDG